MSAGYSSFANQESHRGILALLVWFLWCASAVAGPPLVTDDPETPGQGGWEVNLSHSVESTRNEFVMESPLIDINYGFLENDQFKVEFAVLSVDPVNEPGHWGISDLLIGYKYRFIEEEQSSWMASFYPQVSTPTGNRHFGLGSGRTELLVPFQFGSHFYDDRLFIYSEIGYNVVLGDNNADGWKYGLAGEWQATDQLEIMGEVGGFAFPHDADPDDVFFNLGLKYVLTENAAFIGSAGRSFRDRSAGTPDFTSFLGFQITWGG